MATIGDRLKALRLQKGLTLEEVGKVLGIVRQTYYRYETGDVSHIPLPNVEKLAVFFGVTPAYLCGWSEPKKEIVLTQEESRLIESFRKLDPASQEMILDLIESRLARLNKRALAEESEFSA